ncbi:MAG: methionyl-tRNA formyltransferase [Pseudomonadota bacterium]
MSDWWQRPRRISVVVDTEGWFDPFARELVAELNATGDRASFMRDAAEVSEGAVAFYLSCLKLSPPAVLARNRLNLVVHASDLPHGRGFSPLVWQVLEGENTIPLTMILAAHGPDTGDVVARDAIHFEGHELNGELRETMGRAIISICVKVLAEPLPPKPEPQRGESTWYRRRGPADSKLDPALPLVDQFNLLRTVDNDRYPAFFDHLGRRFVLTIEDSGPVPEEGEHER